MCVVLCIDFVKIIFIYLFISFFLKRLILINSYFFLNRTLFNIFLNIVDYNEYNGVEWLFMKLSKVFLILFFCLSSSLFSQSIRHITVNDGLPQSFVSGIEQGDNGFIWISTRNGLVRFDGNDFKIFQHNPKNEKSLASNLIIHIEKLETNKLCVYYESGEIDVLNMATEKINHIINKDFLNTYTFSDNNKTLLVSSDYSYWFYSSFNKLNKASIINNTQVEKREFVFPDDTIRGLFEDGNKKTWVLSEKKIRWFNKKTNNFKEVDIPFELNYNDTSYFRFDLPRIFQRKGGNILWSDKDYIYEYKPTEESFIRTPFPKSLNHSLQTISFGKNDEFYFLIDQDLYVYDDKIKFKAKLPLKVNNNVKSFLVDDSGLLWVALNTDGVYQIDLSYQFQNFDYKESFAVDLLQDYYGIDAKIEKNNTRLKGLPLPLSYFVRSQATENEIWIALNHTVYRHNFKTNKNYSLPNIIDKDVFDPIAGISVTDKTKPIVILDSGKIFYYEEALTKWKNILETPIFDIESKGEWKPNGLVVLNNKLWITTKSSGLFYYDLEKNKVYKIGKEKFPVSNLIDIIKDPECPNILWVASYSGLIKFNTHTAESQIFSTNEGLPDNTIYSILTDANAYLWLGTNAGLCRFDTRNFTQKTFTSQHGIALLEYNRHHKIKLPNGFFAFGGTQKGVLFNPLSVKTDNFKPSTAITAIEVNNESLDSLGQTNIIDNLKLSYDENNLSLQYSALQYNQPQDINYRYRLIGYDQDDSWKEVGERKQAIYTKIPPGEYIFEVNASNTSAIWSDKVKRLVINVAFPWWDTWWAWSIYFLLFTLLVFGFIRYQVSRKVMVNTLELEQKEAARLRELDEVKSNFFSNITHELRTPLSLIIGPIDRLKRDIKNRDQQELLDVVSKNGKSLLKLTDQLLDFSKVQAGVLKPTYSKGNVGGVVYDVINAFKDELHQKKITCNYNNNIEGVYSFSKEFLDRIIYNLLSNAIKYNNKEGSVIIELNEIEKGISISVTDTGIGISDKHLKNIFNRYYRENSIESAITGSGIGLSLVEELVNLQQGKISVESQTENPSGTTFTVVLPYEKESIKSARKDEFNSPIEASDDQILIVEDNQELRSFIENSLKKYYKITVAESGEEAYKIAEKTIPDLIVTDVMMTGMTGIDLCEKLKENLLTSHVPVIMLTAKADTESKLKGLSSGANEYLYKPFNIEELMLRIRNLLDFKNKQRTYIQKNLKNLPERKTKENVDENKIEDAFLVRIYEIIDANLKDEKFNVEQLAENVNMSRTSLHRKIKSISNLSAGQIIKLRKLKKAVKLLQQDYTISEVSYQTGFGSPSYFSKCFKDAYQVSPSQYLER